MDRRVRVRLSVIVVLTGGLCHRLAQHLASIDYLLRSAASLITSSATFFGQAM